MCYNDGKPERARSTLRDRRSYAVGLAECLSKLLAVLPLAILHDAVGPTAKERAMQMRAETSG